MQGFSAVRARACAGPGLTDKPQARATEGRRQAGQAQVLAHGAADLRQGTAFCRFSRADCELRFSRALLKEQCTEIILL